MPALVRTDDVRRQNTRSIIQVLRRHGCVSRTEIVEYTGLSPATVSTITSTLITDGLLLSRSELGKSQETVSRRGRPRVTLSLNPEIGCIVVIVLSINKLTACGSFSKDNSSVCIKLVFYVGHKIKMHHWFNNGAKIYV